jgi:hypothetical protein
MENKLKAMRVPFDSAPVVMAMAGQPRVSSRSAIGLTGTRSAPANVKHSRKAVA